MLAGGYGAFLQRMEDGDCEVNTRAILPPMDTPGISTRELECLKLAKFHNDVEISKLMKVSTHTVKAHLSSVRLKYRDHLDRLRLGKLQFSPDIRNGSYL